MDLMDVHLHSRQAPRWVKFFFFDFTMVNLLTFIIYYFIYGHFWYLFSFTLYSSMVHFFGEEAIGMLKHF